MVDLVTVEEAEVHLRLDTDEALWLAIFIPAISEAVIGWLKDEWRVYVPAEVSGVVVVDADGNPVPAVPLVPRSSVKAAVLLELANLFRNREGEGTDNVVSPDGGWGYVLNKGSTAILAPLRKSTLV